MMGKEKRLCLLRLVALACLLAAAPALAEQLYVDRDRLDLKAGKGAFYATTGSARRGDRLDVLDRSGGWVQVKTAAGAKGWVFSAALSNSASSFSQLKGRFLGTSSTSELDKTAGYKGFDSVTTAAYVERNKLGRQMAQVKGLERPCFKPGELEAFAAEGGLRLGAEQ
jgi:uncharacterized protein YgiM (DUF1202 family)